MSAAMPGIGCFPSLPLGATILVRRREARGDA
jgi:hypothetical protein